MTTQHYQHPTLGTVAFIDTREQVHSVPCQPRDIQVIHFGLTNTQMNGVQAEITVDIRIGCGMPEHKAARNMKW